MSREIRQIINAFNAGELSPDMDGRTDHEKYYTGCRILRNFISRPHGSVYRRPGLRFVAAAKNASTGCRIIDFDFNNTEAQAYVIELGHLYARFYMDRGLILAEGGTPYEIATPWTAEQVWQLRYVQSADVLYFVHPNVPPQAMTRTAHNVWTLTQLHYKIQGYDLAGILDTNADGKKDGKAGDTFTLPAGKSFEEKYILKGETPEGEARFFHYLGDGLFHAEEGGEGLTVTFKDGDKLDYDAGEIESIYGTDGKITPKWDALKSDDSAPECWKEGNWPSVIGFYEGRLVLGATPEKPLHLWYSRTEGYTPTSADFRMDTSMDGVPLDDDAIEKQLTGSKVTPIRWVEDQDELLLGTNAGEHKCWSGVDGEPVTPKNCQVKRQSANGSGDVPARMVGSSVLFVTRSGRTVRRMAWNVESYKYQASPITLLAEHITAAGIVDWDYSKEPDGVLWCVRKDGVLAACTYHEDQSVIAWHRHDTPGGAVESVCSIPGQNGDETWCVVRRRINGQDVRYIEVMGQRFETDGEDARDAFFVDSGLSYDNPKTITGATTANPIVVTCAGHGLEPGNTVLIEGVNGMPDVNDRYFLVGVVGTDTFEIVVDGTGFGVYESGGTARLCKTVIAGLDHLEGERVQILADGREESERVVSGGMISLTKPAARVHAGIGYVSLLQPMRLEVPMQTGTMQARTKRIMGVTVRFRNTISGMVCPGNDDADRYERVLSTVTLARSGPPTLLSTDKHVELSGDYDTEGIFTVRQDRPFPMDVVCVIAEVDA